MEKQAILISVFWAVILVFSSVCFGAAPVLEVSPLELDFTAEKGGVNPADEIVSIWRGGGNGPLNWEVAEDCNWLVVEPNSGTSMGEVDDVNVIVDISGLTGGTYNYQITVTADGADNSPQIIDVELVVIGPILEVSANSFEFTGTAGGPNPAKQILSIRNTGGGVLNWEISEDCNWLVVEPNSGTSMGEEDDVNVIVDISGLTGGTYNSQITVAAEGANNSPQMVDVTLYLEVNYEAPEDVQIFPENPTSSDVVYITLSGWYINACVPNEWLVEFGGGNTILFHAFFDGTGSCLPGSYPWELTGNFGPLEPGSYTVFVTVSVYPYYSEWFDFVVRPAGDLDFDFDVDLYDYSTLASAWMSDFGSPHWNPVCDITGDFVVDMSDFVVLAYNWLAGVSDGEVLIAGEGGIDTDGSVVITLVDDGDGWVAVAYDATAAEPNFVRAFALDIVADGTGIFEIDSLNPDYWVYPGSIYIDANGEVNDFGSPVADPCVYPGTLGGLDTSGITIEMCALFDPLTESPPPATGTLLRVRIGGNAEVCATENTARGGVVMSDGSGADPVIGCAVGCPCLGDVDGSGSVNFNDLIAIYAEMITQYPIGDPTFVYDIGMPIGLECADVDGSGSVNFSDLAAIYGEIVRQYPTGDPIKWLFDIGCPF